MFAGRSPVPLPLARSAVPDGARGRRHASGAGPPPAFRAFERLLDYGLQVGAPVSVCGSKPLLITSQYPPSTLILRQLTFDGLMRWGSLFDHGHYPIG